jgi:hypothetical protein
MLNLCNARRFPRRRRRAHSRFFTFAKVQAATTRSAARKKATAGRRCGRPADLCARVISAALAEMTETRSSLWLTQGNDND